jgi:hypothetical protein
MQAQKTTRRKRKSAIMSQLELGRLGGGQIAYIKPLSAEEATRLFPAMQGIPTGIQLFALNAADGTPIALTDSRNAAVGHAMEDELAVASLH